MNPYLADRLVRLHQQELMDDAQRHRRIAAARRPRRALAAWRLLPTVRQTAAPCCA